MITTQSNEKEKENLLIINEHICSEGQKQNAYTSVINLIFVPGTGFLSPWKHLSILVASCQRPLSILKDARLCGWLLGSSYLGLCEPQDPPLAPYPPGTWAYLRSIPDPRPLSQRKLQSCGTTWWVTSSAYLSISTSGLCMY